MDPRLRGDDRARQLRAKPPGSQNVGNHPMRRGARAIYSARMRRPTREPIAAPSPETYLVEHYWPGITADAFRSAVARLRSTSRAMARGGVPIRYLHSTMVPSDEAAFCVLSAASPELIEQLYARVGLRFDRIVAAVEM